MAAFRALRPPQRQPLQPRGFSVAELLIGVLLTVTVVGAGTWALLSLIRSEGINQQELNRKDDGDRMLAVLQEEIRNARRIDTPAAGGSPLSGCTHSPTLILRGNTTAEDMSYASVAPASLSAATVVNRSSISWRGPRVLVRCGFPYTSSGSLDTTANRTEQVVLDSLRERNVGDGGFIATTASPTSSTLNRNLSLELISDVSGQAVSSTVQVPVNSNDVYGLLSSNTSSCASTSGCLDPNQESRYFTPAAGATVDGSLYAGQEIIVYFTGFKSDYSISTYNCPGNDLTTCYRVQARTGAPVNIINGNVIVFRDAEIRI